MELKNKLEEFRKNAVLEQKELAKILGISQQTVQNIENGTLDPPIDTALKISKYFNVMIDDIFMLDEQDNPRNTEQPHRDPANS